MKKTLHHFLLSIAKDVRIWTEDKDQLLERPTGCLSGWCAIAAAELNRRLTAEGIASEIHMSEMELGCHCYVVVEDHVLDVTATQFWEHCNTPVLFMHCREAETFPHYCGAQVYRDAEALRKAQKKQKWPADQIAYPA